MTVSTLIEYLKELMEDNGDVNVVFSDYEAWAERDEQRSLGVNSAFMFDGTIYISDAPWWEIP